MRKYVAFAGLMTAAVLLAPLGANATPARSQEYCLGYVFQAVNQAPQPGDTVRFVIKLTPTYVQKLTITVDQLQRMPLLKKGSARFRVGEDGKPYWTLHDLRRISFFRFNAVVSKNAPRGKRLLVHLHSLAQSDSCNQTNKLYLPLHVPKHG